MTSPWARHYPLTPRTCSWPSLRRVRRVAACAAAFTRLPSIPRVSQAVQRLIDDDTVVLAGVSCLQVNTCLNELDRRLHLVGLKVTWVVHAQFNDTLDLHVYKPEGML